MYLADVESSLNRFGCYRHNGVEIKFTARGLFVAHVKGRFIYSYSLPELVMKVEYAQFERGFYARNNH